MSDWRQWNPDGSSQSVISGRRLTNHVPRRLPDTTKTLDSYRASMGSKPQVPSSKADAKLARRKALYVPPPPRPLTIAERRAKIEREERPN